MAKKKDDQDQIPLSETQNTAITGREDVRDEIPVLSGTAEEIGSKLKKALNKAIGKDEEEKEIDPFWAARNFRITDATLKEGLCNYGFEITSGVGIGDTHNVKGSALHERDLAEAFSKFNVHLAVIDDAFKAKEIEVKDINLEHNHELAGLYNVTGFKIKGTEESESIVLIGNKYISSGGRLELTAPKIPLDSFSSYKWVEDLKAAADNARKEVALYKEGKCTPVEQEEEEKPKLKQTNLFVEAKVSARMADELDEDFAEAAV